VGALSRGLRPTARDPTVSAPLGALAAVGTAVAFAIGSTVFTLASLRAGAMAVNRLRLVMAVVWLALAHLAAGLPLPLDVGGQRWLLLGTSGVVGLVLGDAFLFQAFVAIGPRLSMLLMALAPAMAGLLAWWFLGEALSAGQIAGMLVTLGGIAWVVLERDGQAVKSGPDPGRGYLTGILYGLGGAAGQAGGLVLAKEAVADGFPALSATLMRMVVQPPRCGCTRRCGVRCGRPRAASPETAPPGHSPWRARFSAPSWA
jgi:drug/metabolite transporter (DMT)-like permease